MKLHESEEAFYSVNPVVEVGRDTAPADIGRRGGRPYVGVRPKLLLSIKLASRRPAATLKPETKFSQQKRYKS